MDVDGHPAEGTIGILIECYAFTSGRRRERLRERLKWREKTVEELAKEVRVEAWRKALDILEF